MSRVLANLLWCYDIPARLEYAYVWIPRFNFVIPIENSYIVFENTGPHGYVLAYIEPIGWIALDLLGAYNLDPLGGSRYFYYVLIIGHGGGENINKSTVEEIKEFHRKVRYVELISLLSEGEFRDIVGEEMNYTFLKEFMMSKLRPYIYEIKKQLGIVETITNITKTTPITNTTTTTPIINTTTYITNTSTTPTTTTTPTVTITVTQTQTTTTLTITNTTARTTKPPTKITQTSTPRTTSYITITTQTSPTITVTKTEVVSETTSILTTKTTEVTVTTTLVTPRRVRGLSPEILIIVPITVAIIIIISTLLTRRR